MEVRYFLISLFGGGATRVSIGSEKGNSEAGGSRVVGGLVSGSIFVVVLVVLAIGEIVRGMKTCDPYPWTRQSVASYLCLLFAFIRRTQCPSFHTIPLVATSKHHFEI